MARKVKFGKITIVIFITVLIWVWADLALDEERTFPNAIINVAQSNPQLWVTLDGAAFVSIEEIAFKGPLKRINELSRRMEQQKGLKFDFDAAEEGMGKSGSYTLLLVSFLEKEVRRFDLKVESCKPETLSVDVSELINKSVTVECLDEDKIPLKAESIESIEPKTVDAFVPADEMPTAKVQLTRREIDQARISAITKLPYIELPGGQIRNVAAMVEIKMPPAEDELRDYTITAPTLGFSLSENLQGKYKVQLLNEPSDMATVRIKATLAAKQVYEEQPFQMILYILDDDRMTTEEQRKPVVFNFPKDSIRKNEIRLNQEYPIAQFRLIPLTSSESGEEQ